MSGEKKLQIRNSTAEFLIFTTQSGENTIEVRVENETVWLTQKLMAELFQVSVPTVNEHLNNIFKQEEISREATIRKFRIVQTEGGRQVNREVDFYNLDAIISVGYRVNSLRATQFRQWATSVLRDFAIITPARLPMRSPKLLPKVNLKNTGSCRTGFLNRILIRR
jgi:hypothetical protein